MGSLLAEILPWQEKNWQLLQQAKNNNRLPHGLLFVGAKGLGKMRVAELFSAAILCDRPSSGIACGECHSCVLVRAKSHPDLCILEPEGMGQVIKIDQIRQVVHAANETTMQGNYRIIIINPAAAMNLYAANALLKTLEEAAPKTLFILISDQNLRLPATIVSRCQKIIFQKPTTSTALAWLQTQALEDTVDRELLLNLAEGAPLQALALLEQGSLSTRHAIYQGLAGLSDGNADPLQLAAEWQEYDALLLLNLVLFWLRDLLRLQLTLLQAKLINEDYRSVYLHLLKKISQKKLLTYLDYIQDLYAKLLKMTNLNRQLLLEDLLIQWAYCYVSG